MAYNKKDEDENSVVKVDRTSVFQEGKPCHAIHVPIDQRQLKG
jgi:hypothetical protein